MTEFSRYWCVGISWRPGCGVWQEAQVSSEQRAVVAVVQPDKVYLSWPLLPCTHTHTYTHTCTQTTHTHMCAYSQTQIHMQMNKALAHESLEAPPPSSLTELLHLSPASLTASKSMDQIRESALSEPDSNKW